MVDVFFDPSRATNGSGTFASPYNTWAGVTPVAGNRYLQKWGTTFAGSIGPLGTGGTVNNRIIIGVYDPVTEAYMQGVKGGAFVNATGQSFGFNITQARPYITVDGFEVYGATSAAVTKTSTSSSSTEAQYCWFENCIFRDSLGAGADIRGKGNRLRNCDIYGNASDGLFIVGDDFELGHSRLWSNGLTNADGDCVQLRDASNFYIHDSDIDHAASIYKQALICTLENVLGTTGGRIVNNRIACAQYVSGVTAADQKTLQVLTPGVKVQQNTIEGGQFGAYLQGAGSTFADNLVIVNGAGSVIGVAIRETDIAVLRNTVIGNPARTGLTGIDHSDTAYTGTTIYGNALKGWTRGIRTAASGALYSHNGFENVDVRNSDVAGAEGTAGTGDVTGELMLSSFYRPMPGSPLFGAGLHLAYARDRDGRQRRNPPAIGAFDAATLVTT